MGTITAQSIITKTSVIFQDTANTEHPALEQLGWLNDGQIAIVIAKPDANAVIADLTTVVGSRQTIPATWHRLLDIYCNKTGSARGRAITKAARRTLDIATPDWHAETPVADARHYTYDPRTPRTFFLYPPIQAGQVIEAAGSAIPAALTALTDTIVLDDVWAPALQDYILYRGYTKNNGDGDAGRATLHLQAFSAAIGTKAGSDAASDAEQQPAMGS